MCLMAAVNLVKSHPPFPMFNKMHTYPSCAFGVAILFRSGISRAGGEWMEGREIRGNLFRGRGIITRRPGADEIPALFMQGMFTCSCALAFLGVFVEVEERMMVSKDLAITEGLAYVTRMLPPSDTQILNDYVSYAPAAVIRP